MPVNSNSLMPEIKPRQPGFNPYVHYGMSTRRGVKFAAKKEYADKIMELWFKKGLVKSTGTMFSVEPGLIVPTDSKTASVEALL